MGVGKGGLLTIVGDKCYRKENYRLRILIQDATLLKNYITRRKKRSHHSKTRNYHMPIAQHVKQGFHLHLKTPSNIALGPAGRGRASCCSDTVGETLMSSKGDRDGLWKVFICSSIYLVKYLRFLRKNPMNREAWRVTVPGVTKSRTQLSIKGSQCLCRDV